MGAQDVAPLRSIPVDLALARRGPAARRVTRPGEPPAREDRPSQWPLSMFGRWFKPKRPEAKPPPPPQCVARAHRARSALTPPPTRRALAGSRPRPITRRAARPCSRSRTTSRRVAPRPFLRRRGESRRARAARAGEALRGGHSQPPDALSRSLARAQIWTLRPRPRCARRPRPTIAARRCSSRARDRASASRPRARALAPWPMVGRQVEPGLGVGRRRSRGAAADRAVALFSRALSAARSRGSGASRFEQIDNGFAEMDETSASRLKEDARRSTARRPRSAERLAQARRAQGRCGRGGDGRDGQAAKRASLGQIADGFAAMEPGAASGSRPAPAVSNDRSAPAIEKVEVKHEFASARRSSLDQLKDGFANMDPASAEKMKMGVETHDRSAPAIDPTVSLKTAAHKDARPRTPPAAATVKTARARTRSRRSPMVSRAWPRATPPEVQRRHERAQSNDRSAPAIEPGTAPKHEFANARKESMKAIDGFGGVGTLAETSCHDRSEPRIAPDVKLKPAMHKDAAPRRRRSRRQDGEEGDQRADRGRLRRPRAQRRAQALRGHD